MRATPYLNILRDNLLYQAVSDMGSPFQSKKR